MDRLKVGEGIPRVMCSVFEQKIKFCLDVELFKNHPFCSENAGEGYRVQVLSKFVNLANLIESKNENFMCIHFPRFSTNNDYFAGDVESMESPTTALWLYLLIAQHYDKIGQFQVALKFADRAEAHTPTLIETLMIKAKIYKVRNALEFFQQIMVTLKAISPWNFSYF